MKQITFEDLTKKERFIISEYIYSYNQDILIRGDAIELIDLFKGNDIIDSGKYAKLTNDLNNSEPNIVNQLNDILSSAIDDENFNKIMNEYFGDANEIMDALKMNGNEN